MLEKIKSLFHSLMFKLFMCIILIIGPLIIVHIVLNHYSVDVLRNQVAQSNKNMLNIYMDQIEQNLKGIEKYLFHISENNQDLLLLQPGKLDDYNDYLETKLRLFHSIHSQSYFYTSIDSIFVYSNVYGDIIHTQKLGASYLEKLASEEEILGFIQNEAEHHPNGKWFLWEGEKEHYLLYLLKNDQVYVGSWVKMENLLVPFKHIDFGDKGTVLMTTSELQPITNQAFIVEEGMDITLSDDRYRVSGVNETFVMMKEYSSKGDFYIITIIPEREIMEQLPFLQRISSYTMYGAIVFLILFVFIMRNIFLRPILRIVSAMRKLRQGKLDTRLPQDRHSIEFDVMNETFNHMISELKYLKIHVYEEKLKLQRAELKHLQLQINPHFFLNSLNIIYNLAQVKDYALVKEMAKCLSSYFRFMFRSNSFFVSLEDEIKHTENYLKIQKLRFLDHFTYDIETNPTLMSCKIPPLVVQTIAENSIQHAMSIDAPIHLSISIREDIDDLNFYTITIQDTGEGFPEDILARLQNGEAVFSEDGQHIGIWNVKRRLSLLYGDSTSIFFSNEQESGACVSIRLPIDLIE